MTFDLTPEQSIVRDEFGTKAHLVVQAGAGAGKTSTLNALAKSAPGRRGIYIAYNRAIKDEAATKFPKSVRCVTGHGLAYGAVGKNYSHRLNNNARQNARVVCQLLGINRPVKLGADRPPVAPMMLARMVKETIARFCKSADNQVMQYHVPRRKGHSPAEYEKIARAVLPFAVKAWADLSRLDGGLRFEHDHYLKLWALTNPVLRYDYLLLDEAQDTNRLMVRVVTSQQHAQQIAVGDSAQAINGWNGAIDALDTFPGRQLTLSQSFRFGPALAEEANVWLDLLNAKIRLRGFDKIPTTVGPVLNPDAILTRTNAGAMGEAMPLMKAGKRVAIVGGGSAMEQLGLAAIDLKAGRTTDHPELIAFANWGQVEDYAENEADGADLRPLVALIEEHGADEVVNMARMLSDEKRAETVVSTAHKSKGREWDRVKLGSDFEQCAPKENAMGGKLLRRDTAMLCYVAVTRARLALDCESLSWVDHIDGMAP